MLFYLLLLIVAFLYAAVGHGGASGYLALMSFFAFETGYMRSAALLLNLLVAGLSFFQYYRAGHFTWHLFWPFALASVPAAFAGSLFVLDAVIYRKVLGFLLLLPMLRLFGFDFKLNTQIPRKMPLMLLTGGLIGFLSGMIGIGGGIILSPLIIIFNWADMKHTAAVSALFILVNSLAGLAGLFSKGFETSGSFFTMVGLVFAGGLLGSYLGARKFDNKILKQLLALGLLVASLKLLLT